MRPNKRPPLKASDMPASYLNLREGERRQAVCPDCDCWAWLQRGIIQTHHPNGQRCRLGSGRQIMIDLTPEEWGQRLAEEQVSVAGRRATTVHPKPTARPAPAVTQMRARHITSGEQHRLRYAQNQLAAHRKRCRTCTPTEPIPGLSLCRTGVQLRQQVEQAQNAYQRATATTPAAS